MKNIFLTVVALLFVGTAFAQGPGTNPYNESIIDATGENTGDIYQDIGIGVEGSFSDLWQSGTNNYAYVTQIGNNNSFITQAGTANFAVILQDKEGNPSSNRQVSDVSQLGSSNYAYVEQVGVANRGNESDIDQDNNVAAAGMIWANWAEVYQIEARNNTSKIDQTNWANYAFHSQTDRRSSATSIQVSDAAAAGVGVDFQSSIILQSGRDNFALVDQTGVDNISFVDQSGGYSGPPIMGAFRNEAEVTQNGELNDAMVTQRDSALGANDAMSKLTLTQTNLVGGTGNSFNIVQQGSGSLTINQTNN